MPPPYGALLGIVWDVPAPKGIIGEGSVVAFFGSGHLFDLEEILAEVVLPITDTSSISLSASLRAAGADALTLAWDLRL